MLPHVIRRALAALSSLALAATVAFIVPTAAEAATYRAYGGSSYGSTAKFGTVINLGRTANQPLCTTRSGVTKSNHTAAVRLPNLGSIGAQTTTVQSKKSGSTQSSITTSSTAGANLLGGVIRANAIVSKATVTRNSSGYHPSGTTTFVGLTVLGVPLSARPAKNTTIQLPGLGKLGLNEQSTSTSFGNHTQGVNGLRLILNPGNTAGLPAGQLVISYALASLHSPTHNRPYGYAYATQVKVGSVLSSGPSAIVDLPCGGSSGATRTNNIASLALSDALAVGAAVTTAKSTDSATSTNATTTATIAGVNLLSGVVTADVVKAKSSTTRKGTTVTRSSAGTTIANLKINGNPVTITIRANTRINIAGVGTLYLRRSVSSSSGLQVYAVQLVLSTAQRGLPAGAVLIVGSAQSGVS